jgi:diketogulonate reductase-like aldo/keto reductase
VDEGIVRSIGVSNFGVDQIAELAQWARIRPALLQLNSEPLRPAVAEQALCRRLGIQFESYSTLGGQYAGDQAANPVLRNPSVLEIARAKGITPAQVVLRWALQLGQTVVPRSANPEHMRENLQVLGARMDLSDEEMDSLAALATERRRYRRLRA